MALAEVIQPGPAEPLVEVDDLDRPFPGREAAGFWREAGAGWSSHAIEQHTLLPSIMPGEGRSALVGESGSGKTTTGGRCCAGADPRRPDPVRGRDITKRFSGEDLRQTLHRNMQLIFQDPYASLNPRSAPSRHFVAEPLIVHGPGPGPGGGARPVVDLLRLVGRCRSDAADRLPRTPSPAASGSGW